MKTIEELIVFGANEADIKDLRSIPNSGGVYFLCKDLDILYIGQSGSMRERVKSHFRAKKANRILFIRYGGRVRFAFEKLFIQIFRPIFNQKKPDLPDNIESLLDMARGIAIGIDSRERGRI